MKYSPYTLIALLMMAVAPAASMATDDTSITRALASDVRQDADRERDARSHPEVILGLLDIEPGQTVIDVFGGGGYYSDILVGVVGEAGQVILHNNTPYSSWVEKQNKERYIDNPVPGITYLKSEVDDLQLAPNSLDAALMVMSYHDLYFYNPDRGWNKTDVPLFFKQLNAALKSGGKLLIVDHAAPDGTGSSAAQELHRIEEAYARQDLEKNGFQFVASSDALRNPDDDKTKMVFDKSVRGKTDRFILLFEKP